MILNYLNFGWFSGDDYFVWCKRNVLMVDNYLNVNLCVCDVIDIKFNFVIFKLE